MVTLSKNCDGVKELLFTRYGIRDLIVPVALPKSDEKAKPLDKTSATVAPGTKTITLTGPGIGDISTVQFGKNALPTAVLLDGKR